MSQVESLQPLSRPLRRQRFPRRLESLPLFRPSFRRQLFPRRLDCPLSPRPSLSSKPSPTVPQVKPLAHANTKVRTPKLAVLPAEDLLLRAQRKRARRVLLVRVLTLARPQLAPVPLRQRRVVRYKSGSDGGRRRRLEDGQQIGVNSTHHILTNLATRTSQKTDIGATHFDRRFGAHRSRHSLPRPFFFVIHHWFYERLQIFVSALLFIGGIASVSCSYGIPMVGKHFRASYDTSPSI
jgi:hypothetical protein